MQKKNNSTNEEDLKYILIPRQMFKDYDVTLTTVSIYSYMLARFRFFKAMNKEYFESIESIAENCFCSTASVKTALNFLSKNSFLDKGKLKGATYNKNVYNLYDKYNLFSIPKSAQDFRQSMAWLDEEEGLPF